MRLYARIIHLGCMNVNPHYCIYTILCVLLKLPNSSFPVSLSSHKPKEILDHFYTIGLYMCCAQMYIYRAYFVYFLHITRIKKAHRAKR